MTEHEIIDSELIATTPRTALSLGSLPISTPADMVRQASEIATVLAEVIKSKQLYKNIQGRNHVLVEGWTTLGAMLGVIAREMPEYTRRLDDGSYEGAAELVRLSDGAIVGRASARCGVDELDKYGKPIWGSRPEYARRSMAVTRATGKAFRLSFSWIMNLAGYEVTPAEEMVSDPDIQSHPEPNGDHGLSPDAKQVAERIPKLKLVESLPRDPESVVSDLAHQVADYLANRRAAVEDYSQNAIGTLAGKLDKLCGGSDNRHAVLEYVIEQDTLKGISNAQGWTLTAWADSKHAQAEIDSILFAIGAVNASDVLYGKEEAPF